MKFFRKKIGTRMKKMISSVTSSSPSNPSTITTDEESYGRPSSEFRDRGSLIVAILCVLLSILPEIVIFASILGSSTVMAEVLPPFLFKISVVASWCLALVSICIGFACSAMR